ncbi:hypothetical protein G6F60_002069 [Rhizopus arrhizus]|nr:hypothetical protein G6F60_002069 [Rhizopus arrhizus]
MGQAQASSLRLFTLFWALNVLWWLHFISPENSVLKKERSGDASYANTSPQVNDKAKFEDTKVESKQELAQPTNTRYAAAPTATGYASSQYGTSTNNTNNHLPYNYPAYQQSSQQQPSQYGMQQPFYGNQQPHYMPPQQQPSQQQQQPGYWQQQQPSQQNTTNPPGLAKQEDEKSRMN